MKIAYLTSQMKQFLLSSILLCVIVGGISISNSFDIGYLIQADLKSETHTHNSKVALNDKVEIKKSLSDKLDMEKL